MVLPLLYTQPCFVSVKRSDEAKAGESPLKAAVPRG